MGWNLWNAYDCDITEAKFLDAAKKIVSPGLNNAAYEYVNIDDKVHVLGLKIGIYSSAGTETCAGYPASIGYEEIGAETWAEWGIDYDNCNLPANWTDVCDGCVPDSKWGSDYVNGTCTCPGNWCPASNTAKRYRIMRDALANQKRPILYTASTTRSSVASRNGAMPQATHGARQSTSNLLGAVGTQTCSRWATHNPGLSAAETRSHLALWAAMKNPLLIVTYLSAISDDNVAVLKNKHLLAFNQDDVYGAPATPYKWGTNPDWTFNASHPVEYWSGEFRGGTLALIFNPYSSTKAVILRLARYQLTAKQQDGGGGTQAKAYRVIEIGTDKDLGYFKDYMCVDNEGHDTVGAVLRECQADARYHMYL